MHHETSDSSPSLKANFLIEALTCLRKAFGSEQRLQLMASRTWKVCNPRSFFLGAVAHSTGPRVTTSIGASLMQIISSQYSSASVHKQQAVQEAANKSSNKISNASQIMSRCHSSFLGCCSMQTSVTCTSNTPSHSSGLGFASTTFTSQTGRKNSREVGSMEKNNLGPSSSQWVQVGVHLTTTTASQTSECGVGSQGSSYLR